MMTMIQCKISLLQNSCYIVWCTCPVEQEVKADATVVAQMKKETKKLVGFEEALLNNYRHYLESLEKLAAGYWKLYL